MTTLDQGEKKDKESRQRQNLVEKRAIKEDQVVEKERKKALDEWKKERQEQLETLFPLICPDYLGKRLAGLVKNNRLTKGLEDRYQELLDEQGKGDKGLPRRSAWEKDRKWREEEVRWTSMEAAEFLRHVPDPETHFLCPLRISSLPSSYTAAARAQLLENFPAQAASLV